MQIRRAEKRDLDGVNQLLHQVLEIHAEIRPDLFVAGTRKYSNAELMEIFASEDKPVFVAEEAGRILGYCFCVLQETKGDLYLHDARTLYIDDLCVDESARGKHVGKALYEHVLSYAKQIDCQYVTLHVWEGNDRAKGFYESMGMHVRKTMMEKTL